MSIITPPPYGRPDYSLPQPVLDGPVREVSGGIAAGDAYIIVDEACGPYARLCFAYMVVPSPGQFNVYGATSTASEGATWSGAGIQVELPSGYTVDFPLAYVKLDMPYVYAEVVNNGDGEFYYAFNYFFTNRSPNYTFLNDIVNTPYGLNAEVPVGVSTIQLPGIYEGPYTLWLYCQGAIAVGISAYVPTDPAGWLHLGGVTTVADEWLTIDINVPPGPVELTTTNNTGSSQLLTYTFLPTDKYWGR